MTIPRPTMTTMMFRSNRSTTTITTTTTTNTTATIATHDLQEDEIKGTSRLVIDRNNNRKSCSKEEPELVDQSWDPQMDDHQRRMKKKDTSTIHSNTDNKEKKKGKKKWIRAIVKRFRRNKDCKKDTKDSKQQKTKKHMDTTTKKRWFKKEKKESQSISIHPDMKFMKKVARKVSTTCGIGNGAMIGLLVLGPPGAVVGAIVGGVSCRMICKAYERKMQREHEHNIFQLGAKASKVGRCTNEDICSFA